MLAYQHQVGVLGYGVIEMTGPKKPRVHDTATDSRMPPSHVVRMEPDDTPFGKLLGDLGIETVQTVVFYDGHPALGPVAIECEHGFDVCPTCDGLQTP